MVCLRLHAAGRELRIEESTAQRTRRSQRGDQRIRGIGIGDTTASGRELRETPTRPHVSPLGDDVAGQGNAESPGSDGASPNLLPAGLSRTRLLGERRHAPRRYADTFPPTVQGLSGLDDPMGEGAKHPNEICVRIL
jgi:hypothetical protein